MKETIKKMRSVMGIYYGMAASTGCHAFIEFTGLMKDFIDMCEQTMMAGRDFRMSNTHNEENLEMKDFQASYLAEKLDCIYGPSLRKSPELRQAFDGH